MNIDGEFLSNLRFADVTFLDTETPQELQHMLQELSDESKRMGIKGTHRSETFFSPFLIIECSKFLCGLLMSKNELKIFINFLRGFPPPE